MRPRILVIDGYTREARETLVGCGASVAGELYKKMIARFLPEAGIDILFPSDAGAELPEGAALADYDGIAWTGCSLTIFHDTPEVRRQIDFARAAFDAKVPSFGSCWAAQIAAVAAGGECRANPKGREMGIARKITLTPEGRAHPMYRGKAPVFDAFISHEDEVCRLPSGGQHLAANAFTHVQAVSVTHNGGVFWGLQYHPEYDLHEMARLTYCRRERLTKQGFFADVAAAEAYVEVLETYFANPSRGDIAWMLAIDSDIMDDDVRQTEVRNWVEHLVLPTMNERR